MSSLWPHLLVPSPALIQVLPPAVLTAAFCERPLTSEPLRSPFRSEECRVCWWHQADRVVCGGAGRGGLCTRHSGLSRLPGSTLRASELGSSP